jgi:predicted metal-binding membrane protein
MSAAVEALLRRDRLVVAAALAVVTALAWTYILWLAADMDMDGMDMEGWRMIPAGIGIMAPAAAPWSALEVALVFAMWAVMMVGMMLPSAAPMILLYAQVGRRAASAGKPLAPTGWFAAGYVAVWIGFAMVATAAQVVLERAAVLTPAMQGASSVLGGIVLIATGLYQWTPLKESCLTQCRSPLHFIQQHGGFRHDAHGSFTIGAKHGGYCVGCCWALMGLLFVGGVMNVLWIAGLSTLVLLEKVLAVGRGLSRIAGLGMGVAGLGLVASAL